MKFLKPILFLLLAVALVPLEIAAQGNQNQPATGTLTLEQTIAYALENQPAVQQAKIDQQIADREIKAALADWFPQISANGNLQHYLKMPVTIFPDENGVLVPRTIGTAN